MISFWKFFVGYPAGVCSLDIKNFKTHAWDWDGRLDLAFLVFFVSSNSCYIDLTYSEQDVKVGESFEHILVIYFNNENYDLVVQT